MQTHMSYSCVPLTDLRLNLKAWPSGFDKTNPVGNISLANVRIAWAVSIQSHERRGPHDS